MPSLRSLREMRGISTRELAERLEIDHGTVSRGERGLRDVPTGVAAHWAMQLHIDMRQLFLLAAQARIEHRREIAATELARVLVDQR